MSKFIFIFSILIATVGAFGAERAQLSIDQVAGTFSNDVNTIDIAMIDRVISISVKDKGFMFQSQYLITPGKATFPVNGSGKTHLVALAVGKDDLKIYDIHLIYRNQFQDVTMLVNPDTVKIADITLDSYSLLSNISIASRASISVSGAEDFHRISR